MAPCPQAMCVVAWTEATGRPASAREGAIGPPGCDAPVDSAHERYWSARMNAAAQKKTRRKPENTSCTMGAVSQKTVADLCKLCRLAARDPIALAAAMEQAG